MLLSWRPRYSELRPTASSQINKDLQRRQPVVMFSGSVMMILKLFTRSEGLPSSLIWMSILFCTFVGGGLGFTRILRHIAIHMNLSNKLRWIQQLHQPEISCLSFATSLVVLMEGLGWEPRRYDLVGLERAEERYPIELE